MQQWEYQMVRVVAKGQSIFEPQTVDYERMQQVLNDLGRQGWEVIASTAADTSAGTIRSIVVTLRRPLAP